MSMVLGFFLLASFMLSFHKNDKPCRSLMYCMWFWFEQKSQLLFEDNEQKTAENSCVIVSFTAVGSFQASMATPKTP